MIHFDSEGLDRKCDEIMDDLANKTATSKAWVWMGLGAAVGLVLSCFKSKNKETTPIIGMLKKEGANGITYSKRNLSDNKGLRGKKNI